MSARSARSRWAVRLLAIALCPGAVGTASSQDAPPAHRDGPVVRVTVGLVQIDAVVTDRQGRHVTDLGPADFVVRESGQEREITEVSYVALTPLPVRETVPVASASTATPAGTPTPPRGRTITLVVDDLHVSYEGVTRVRDALHDYLDRRLAPGDRVAILRTGGGVAAMQQFTSDTHRLHAAVDLLRFNYMGMASSGGAATIDSQMAFGGGPASASPSGRQTSEGHKQLARFREELIGVGTLGTLRWIVRGLAPLAGRKPVVVFSDGFKAFDFASGGRMEAEIRALTDEANRGSVVLYTVDTRGLSTDTLRGEDNPAYLDTSALQNLPGQRIRERFDAEESLSYMAARTGGLMIKGSNDPGRGLDRVLDDQPGYYVIGYTPPASFFAAPPGRPTFHKLQVSVRRPGLRVRSRAGFYGVPDTTLTLDGSRGQGLAAALASPFAAADIGLRLQALFVDDEKTGPSLRAMLRIDARDLTLAETADGGRQARLDVAAVTFGAGGALVDSKDQTFTVQARGPVAPAPDTAFFYTVDLPVKKPGPYQFRVVVRDAVSGRLGAAGEVVAVPDLRAGRLALSGIVVRGSDADAATVATDRAQALVGRVKPGSAFEYVFQILNARRDPATARPRLETQVRLLRGREAIYEGPSTPLPVEHSAEGRVAAAGRLDLSSRLPTGDYTLQVIVTDTLAPRAQAVATQWANLEAVRAP